MLNVFPTLLNYTVFAPTLLRVAAALVLFYMAYNHFNNKEHIARTRFPIVGEGAWIPWTALIVELLVALGLFFGAWTQVAALLGALIGFKYALWAGKYPSYFILSRTASLLLLVICLSLMLTGAGQMAFDIPL
jgi:uncharacterized membrane protein YphA (DoxX/SURF4 family)